jgi:hypothetical protein
MGRFADFTSWMKAGSVSGACRRLGSKSARRPRGCAVGSKGERARAGGGAGQADAIGEGEALQPVGQPGKGASLVTFVCYGHFMSRSRSRLRRDPRRSRRRSSAGVVSAG